MAKQEKHSAKCPIHEREGNFIPPSKIDKKRRKLIVTYQCPEGHAFIEEYDLK